MQLHVLQHIRAGMILLRWILYDWVMEDLTEEWVMQVYQVPA